MADYLPKVINNYISPEDAKKEILNECESVWTHMKECQNKLLLLGTEAELESDVKADYLPKVINNYISPEDAKEEILNECESVWMQMKECQNKLLLLGTEAELESDVKADYLPKVTNNYISPEDAKEEILNECESVWMQMKECQNKLLLLGTEAELESDVKADYLPKVTNNYISPEDAKEEILNECESVWMQMKECQNKLLLLGTEAELESDVKADYLPKVINNYISPEDAKEEILNECESVWMQMKECQNKLLLLGTEAELESDVKADYLPKVINNYISPEDAKEEILNECESVWTHMEECQSKLLFLGTEAELESDVKFSLLLMRVKALTAEYYQWQKRNPELISTNPDVLVELGKKELQKVKNELEMMLSAVQSKNKKLEEDLKREQQWHEEQEHVLDTLAGIEEETKIKVQQLPKTSLTARAFQELQNKMSKLRMYKEELLDALGEFLEEHFPLPEEVTSAKKTNSSEEPSIELITLNEILEILIDKLMSTPHEPYVTIDDSYWPPYIELLLRYGIALRHPEDPNRMRLEAFHI